MSQCYPKAREKFLTGQLNWAALGDTYRAVLLPESYVPDFEDEFLADVLSASRIAISSPLTNRTATLGYANSDPIEFLALISPVKAAQALIYKDTGSEATSDLVFFMSMDGFTGVPFDLDGLNYYIYPNAVEGGFFRL